MSESGPTAITVALLQPCYGVDPASAAAANLKRPGGYVIVKNGNIFRYFGGNQLNYIHKEHLEGHVALDRTSWSIQSVFNRLLKI